MNELKYIHIVVLGGPDAHQIIAQFDDWGCAVSLPGPMLPEDVATALERLASRIREEHSAREQANRGVSATEEFFNALDRERELDPRPIISARVPGPILARLTEEAAKTMQANSPYSRLRRLGGVMLFAGTGDRITFDHEVLNISP